MKTFVTFGQQHVHRINSHILDKDTVAVIETSNDPCVDCGQCGREKAFELFGDKFFTTYTEKTWDDSKMSYFPRGYIYL